MTANIHTRTLAAHRTLYKDVFQWCLNTESTHTILGHSYNLCRHDGFVQRQSSYLSIHFCIRSILAPFCLHGVSAFEDFPSTSSDRVIEKLQ